MGITVVSAVQLRLMAYLAAFHAYSVAPALSSGHRYIMMSSSGQTADIATFTNLATSLLTWFITTFGTVLNFMLANPICFVGLVMMMIVAAIGMLRHIIGG